MIQALGICHTVIAEEKDKNGQKYIDYNASSPDELALVNGARHMGFAFTERDEENNMVIKNWNGIEKFKLLNVIEFDSARKRMSVIVRKPDGKILIVCKGADSIIEKRLRPGQSLLKKTQGFLDEYAKTGLRTLLIAQKEVSEEFYNDWAAKHAAAQTVTVNRDKELDKVAELIENDFELIGSTAIEDKL